MSFKSAHIINPLFKILAVLAVSLILLPELHGDSPPGALHLPSGPAPGNEFESDVAAKSLGILYNNKDNPVIEKFSFTGEFQSQWASGSSDQGSYGSRDYNPNSRWGDIDVRRWRLGFESTWFDSIKFWGTINVNPNWNPFYKDIYELALSWSPNQAFNLGVGKIKTRFFTQENNTRSRELVIFEQSLLVNALIPQQLSGVWINGQSGPWIYALAVFAGDYEPEFSQFNAGEVTQASLGYDFAKALKVEKALVKFDYQGSTSAKNSNGPGKFSDAFSLNSTFQNGRFYGYSDMLAGIGRGTQGDVWGVTLTPTYFLVPNRLQAVFRYQYAHGDHDGLNLQQRYEALAPDIISTKGAGSDYNAAYAGFNWYLHGHNLKLMTGVEYNNLTGGPKGFSGWTYLAGVRAAF